jgi:hypothetical protein
MRTAAGSAKWEHERPLSFWASRLLYTTEKTIFFLIRNGPILAHFKRNLPRLYFFAPRYFGVL